MTFDNLLSDVNKDDQVLPPWKTAGDLIKVLPVPGHKKEEQRTGTCLPLLFVEIKSMFASIFTLSNNVFPDKKKNER